MIQNEREEDQDIIRYDARLRCSGGETRGERSVPKTEEPDDLPYVVFQALPSLLGKLVRGRALVEMWDNFCYAKITVWPRPFPWGFGGLDEWCAPAAEWLRGCFRIGGAL